MEKRQTTINDRNYQLLVPPVRQSMPLCTQVAALLGPALGSLGGQADESGWGRFASSLQSVDPLKVDKLFMEAVKISHLCYESKPISDELNFERHFGKHRADVYPVCIWALWECVQDFFPQLATFSQTLTTAVAGVSRSPMDG